MPNPVVCRVCWMHEMELDRSLWISESINTILGASESMESFQRVLSQSYHSRGYVESIDTFQRGY